ncbi:MAG: iron-containing alcohol dehydrogenase [Bacteroidota bacterium]|nr:iron-containing alcohol dehydrogenase [Bacteroidota bacterium]
MENFVMYNPTKVLFGKGIINKLGQTVKEYGNRVLLVYGKGSIKKNGIYDQVISQLNSIGAEVFEYSGIKSNPEVSDVNSAAMIGWEKRVDVILAVGGGSVIDSAKYISVTIPGTVGAWAYATGEATPVKNIPLITVLTVAATGTEMNMFAVIQSKNAEEKLGWGHPLLYPKVSFLDPQFTYSVPADYTAYGAVDIIAHSLEAFFGKGESSLSDRFITSIIKEVMHFTPLVLKNPDNYDYRAALLYASTCALNGMLSHGRRGGDWGVHSIGHELSLIYDIAHGASLSIAYPAWLRFHKEKAKERISYLGRELFNVEDPEETISRLENFFKSIGSPIRLKEAGINEDQHKKLYSLFVKNKVGGSNYTLKNSDYKTIIELMVNG